MLTNGSKLLLAGTTLTVVAAIVYGVTQDGTLGVVGLLSAAIALGLLAGIVIATRDGNVSAMDEAAAQTAVATHVAPEGNVWPLIVAGGAALVVLGLVTQSAFVMLGIGLLLIAGLQWMVDAWSQSASADGTFNRDTRARFAGPLEFPLLATAVGGVVVFSFSRIMLFLSKTAGPVGFVVAAVLILAGGFLFASQRSMRSTAVAGVTAFAALGLVAGGVAAGLDGERFIEEHETTALLREESECDTTDETHADENASQTVGNKAAVMADITLDSDGELTSKAPGQQASQRIVVGRGNPSNIIFHNESDEPRRLTLTTGQRPLLDEEGEEIEGQTTPDQRCTALAEEGGSQLLTFRIDKRSAVADEAFELTVPGVEGQAIEVVVP